MSDPKFVSIQFARALECRTPVKGKASVRCGTKGGKLSDEDAAESSSQGDGGVGIHRHTGQARSAVTTAS